MDKYATPRYSASAEELENVVFDPVPTPPAVVTYQHQEEAIFHCPARLLDYELYTPNSGGSHSAWKNFEHYKLKPFTEPKITPVRLISQWWSNPPVAHIGYVYSKYWGYKESVYGATGRYDYGLPAFYVPGMGKDFVLPPSSFDDLWSRGLKTMLPVIKAELSVPNALYELKDFKNYPAMLRNARKFAGFIGNSGKILRDALRSTASGYLQAKFNILPLLSDISSIHAVLSRTERRINDLITRQGKVQTRHFAFNWNEYLDSDETSSSFSFGNAVASRLLRLERSVRYSPSTFHAELKYNYNYTKFQLAHAQVLSLLDQLGINLNPAILWNAIPWTFVVDFLVGVSRFVDQFAIANMKPEINIIDSLWSIRRQRDILVTRVFASASDPRGGTYSERNPMPAVTETAYRRHVGLPAYSSLTTSGLNSGEFTIGAALVLARRRHRRTRK